MKPELRRFLFSLAVLLWASYLIYCYSSGRIADYLTPGFHNIALAGGLGLAVLGSFNMITFRRAAACGHDHGKDTLHDHEGTDMNPFVTLLLMVAPIGLCMAWTTGEFSKAAIERKGLYDDSPDPAQNQFFSSMIPALTMEEIESTHRRTSDGYLEFSLMEIFFATGDREVQSLMTNLKIETEGRIVEEKVNNPNGTRMRLYRLFMTCCIADSRAIPIVLEFGSKPPELPDNGWVKVAGTLTFPTEEGTLRAVLVVERAGAADAPEEEKMLIR